MKSFVEKLLTIALSCILLMSLCSGCSKKTGDDTSLSTIKLSVSQDTSSNISQNTISEDESEPLSDDSKEITSDIVTIPDTDIPLASPFLVQAYNQLTASMGPGWNLGEYDLMNEKTEHISYSLKSLILSVKEAGFRTIRIPISCEVLAAATSDNIERIREIVDFCLTEDLYTILSFSNQTITKENLDAADLIQYEAIVSQIASLFTGYDEHLILEAWNTVLSQDKNLNPFDSNINTYNQIFIDTIRCSGGNNEKRWLAVTGSITDSNILMPSDKYKSKELNSFNNRIMISLPYYLPWDFCKNEDKKITQWGVDATNVKKEAASSDEGSLAKFFQTLKVEYISNGYPVMISEYGVCDKSMFDSENPYFRAYFIRKINEKARDIGCIPVIWDDGLDTDYGFALFDRKKRSVIQPDLIAAIMDVFYASNEKGTATSVTIEQATLHLNANGNSAFLYTTLTPEDCLDIIYYTSSNEMVATVSKEGEVTPLAAGDTLITASANGHTSTCKVTVLAAKKEAD